MNHEDYCSYELSKNLREKGFNRPTLLHYVNGKLNTTIYFPGEEFSISAELDELLTNTNIPENDPEKFASAPTLYEAQKWLREAHEIHIEPSFRYEGFFDVCIQSPRLSMFRWLREKSGSYEEALSKGIQKALELI